MGLVFHRIIDCPRCSNEIEIGDPDDCSALCEECGEIVLFDVDEEAADGTEKSE